MPTQQNGWFCGISFRERNETGAAPFKKKLKPSNTALEAWVSFHRVCTRSHVAASCPTLEIMWHFKNGEMKYYIGSSHIHVLKTLACIVSRITSALVFVSPHVTSPHSIKLLRDHSRCSKYQHPPHKYEASYRVSFQSLFGIAP